MPNERRHKVKQTLSWVDMRNTTLMAALKVLKQTTAPLLDNLSFKVTVRDCKKRFFLT